MINIETFFEWEDSFDSLKNITADIYVNDSLKSTDILFKRIDVNRNVSNFIDLKCITENSFRSELIKGEFQTYNLKIEIKIKELYYYKFRSIIIYDANLNGETFSCFDNQVELQITANKVEYLSDKENCILKEWYGCNNKLDFFYNGFSTSKISKETITYKDKKNISFVIDKERENHNQNSFWVKLKDYKFKVCIIKDKYDEYGFFRYALEYRKKWGLIPNEETRRDISNFLSFIIGTKLIKFGESYFNDHMITQKEYLSIMPIDMSLLYQPNLPFYVCDYRCNGTDDVIKQIPKMLQKYFLIKDQYRLNEVLSTLYIKSYLNFNFINYVTYIEMFANIDVGEKPTIISKSRFRRVLKELNKVENIPNSIKNKFQNLNTLGIGKKVQRLLSKNKIDYNRYEDVFSIRGKVVHGAYVDIREMYIASQKAKELLTILTLKKLNYSGNIRNFINNKELISIKDLSSIVIKPTL